MKVDFNNLRTQTAYSLDRVIRILNNGILPDTAYSTQDMPDAKTKQFDGNVLIYKESLQKHIDELRSNVWVLLCCYEEGNPDYKEVSEEVQNNGGLARFNDNEEDED